MVQEMLDVSDEDIIKKALYSDFIATKLDEDTSGIDKLVLSDVNKIAQSILELRAELDTLVKEDTDSKTDSNKEKIKSIKEKLEEKREKFKKYYRWERI